MSMYNKRQNNMIGSEETNHLSGVTSEFVNVNMGVLELRTCIHGTWE